MGERNRVKKRKSECEKKKRQGAKRIFFSLPGERNRKKRILMAEYHDSCKQVDNIKIDSPVSQRGDNT